MYCYYLFITTCSVVIYLFTEILSLYEELAGEGVVQNIIYQIILGTLGTMALK